MTKPSGKIVIDVSAPNANAVVHMMDELKGLVKAYVGLNQSAVLVTIHEEEGI